MPEDAPDYVSNSKPTYGNFGTSEAAVSGVYSMIFTLIASAVDFGATQTSNVKNANNRFWVVS